MYSGCELLYEFPPGIAELIVCNLSRATDRRLGEMCWTSRQTAAKSTGLLCGFRFGTDITIALPNMPFRQKSKWFVLTVKPRHEKATAQHLHSRELQDF